MKIVVYAICKNEEKFVDRWCESMKEADEICVLDTGSDDNSVEKLKANGVNVVVEKIIPWRFDVARNKSLDLISDDTPTVTEYEPVVKRRSDNVYEEEAKEDEIVIVEAPVVTPVEPEPVQEKLKGVEYKIKWGDTLWDIAGTYYKNPWLYREIAKYNGLENPDYIVSGTIITIPPR